MNVEGLGTTEAPDVGAGKAMKLAAEKAYDEIAEREGLDEHGDEVVDMSGDDEPIADPEVDAEPEAEAVEIDGTSEDPQGGTDGEPEGGGKPSTEGGEEPEAPPAAASGEPSGEPPKAPHTWPQEWKDRFSQMPVEMQSLVSEQVQSMNKVFSERMMSLSNEGKRQEAVARSIQPHSERLQRAGISPDVAVARALAWDALIGQNPVEGFRSMAKAYGVDLKAVAQPAESELYLTPQERQMREENQRLGKDVQGIRAYLAQQQREARASNARSRQASAEAVLEDFMNAKDEEGNLLHPHVELCAPMMTRLIDAGVADDLEDAYNMAAQLTPEVQTAREDKRKADERQEAQAAAKKARKASGSGIVGGGNKKPKGAKPAKSFEQRASEMYDKLASNA